MMRVSLERKAYSPRSSPSLERGGYGSDRGSGLGVGGSSSDSSSQSQRGDEGYWEGGRAAPRQRAVEHGEPLVEERMPSSPGRGGKRQHRSGSPRRSRA